MLRIPACIPVMQQSYDLHNCMFVRFFRTGTRCVLFWKTSTLMHNSVLLQIVYEVDHFCSRHGRAHGLVRLIENPERKDNPETVEEGKVEPAKELSVQRIGYSIRSTAKKLLISQGDMLDAGETEICCVELCIEGRRFIVGQSASAHAEPAHRVLRKRADVRVQR